MDSAAAEVISPNLFGLITRERAEKFDLLGQLILNQREAVVVCGAEGIGKTTFFNIFKKERADIWAICLLQGQENLDFEQIQNQLVLVIQQHNAELVNHDLAFLLSFCEQRQRKVVLMIDDAANLAEGLITMLTEYALQHPVLRIVFAFSRQQLYLKNLSDSVLDDCYFMEIPALTKPQTAVFLQDLSIFPDLNNEDHKIDDKLLSKLYQRSGGIPGKIIAELPLLLELQHNKIFTPLKTVLLGFIIFLSATLFYIHRLNHDNNRSNTQSAAHSLPPTAIKSSIKAIAKPANIIKAADSPLKQPELNKALTAETNNQVIQQDVDEQWVLQQTMEKYTLQLIVLSKRQALLDIVKRHHNLAADLKILRIKNKNQEKYVLLYGAFADTKTAYAAVSALPAEFRQAWPRKISTLQQEIKNRTIPLPLPKQPPLKQ